MFILYFLTKNLASAENFAYTVDILSLRVRGAEVKKTEGEEVTICFLCREEILKKQQSITSNDLCFRKVAEQSYCFK